MTQPLVQPNQVQGYPQNFIQSPFAQMPMMPQPTVRSSLVNIELPQNYSPTPQGYYYNAPQASVYTQPGMYCAPYMPQQMPCMPQMIQQAPLPQEQPQMAVQQPPMPPQPQMVEQQPQMPQAPAPVATAPQTPEVPAPAVQAPMPPAIDANALIQKVNIGNTVDPQASPDKQMEVLGAQAGALSEVKNNVNDLMTEEMVKTLQDVITAPINLEKPKPEVLAARQKVNADMQEEEKVKADPEHKFTPQATEEDKKLAEAPTPYDAANMNKALAIVDLALIQKALLDKIDEGKANGTDIPIDPKTLPGIEAISNAAQNAESPEVKCAALAAMSHIARPELKNALQGFYEVALKDENPDVQATAQKAIEKLKTVPDAQAQVPQAPQQPAA